MILLTLFTVTTPPFTVVLVGTCTWRNLSVPGADGEPTLWTVMPVVLGLLTLIVTGEPVVPLLRVRLLALPFMKVIPGSGSV